MKATKLKKLRACDDAIEWVKSQKNPVEAWQNCERGDWMLWLATSLNVNDRKLTLAKATCVKQVEHLLTDQRSKDALEGCFEYAKGKITREELNILATAAYYAAAAASDVAYAAASAAYAASATYVAYAAYATDVAYAADATSRDDSLKKSADICREILTEDILTAYKN